METTRADRGGSVHPLSSVPTSGPPGRSWSSALDLSRVGYLLDHCIFDWPILAGAAYLEIGLSLAPDDGFPAVEGVQFHQPLFLVPAARIELSMRLDPSPAGASWSMASVSADGEEALHATGSVRSLSPASLPGEALGEIRERCPVRVSSEEHYGAVSRRGGEYGPAFRGVRVVWVGEGEALGQVQLPEPAARDAGAYRIHPALLDACLQVGTRSFAQPQGARSRLWVPIRFESLALYRPPGTELWSHALSVPASSPGGAATGEVRLMTGDGELVGAIKGIHAAGSKRPDG